MSLLTPNPADHSILSNMSLLQTGLPNHAFLSCLPFVSVCSILLNKPGIQTIATTGQILTGVFLWFGSAALPCGTQKQFLKCFSATPNKRKTDKTFLHLFSPLAGHNSVCTQAAPHFLIKTEHTVHSNPENLCCLGCCLCLATCSGLLFALHRQVSNEHRTFHLATGFLSLFNCGHGLEKPRVGLSSLGWASEPQRW